MHSNSLIPILPSDSEESDEFIDIMTVSTSDQEEDDLDWSGMDVLFRSYLECIVLPPVQQAKDVEAIAAITELIKEMQDYGGLCMGLTTNVLYSLWLSQQPKRKDAVGKELPRAYQLFPSLLRIGEGDLSRSFEDTRNRRLQQEYSLVSFLTPRDFTKTLKIKEQDKPAFNTTLIDLITPENKMVFIGTPTHQMGMIRIGESIYYYSSHSTEGLLEFPVEAKEKRYLAKEIFRANKFFPKKTRKIGVFQGSQPGDWKTYTRRAQPSCCRGLSC